MPEASTPSASAVLPLTTICGSVLRSAGMRYLKSRFASAQAPPASRADVAVDHGVLLAEGEGDLFAGELDVEAVDAAQHPEREHVLALARIGHERAALASPSVLRTHDSPRPQRWRGLHVRRRDLRIDVLAPHALEQDRATRLERAGTDASEQHLLVERHDEIGFVAAIGDALRADADAVAARACNAARGRLNLRRDDFDGPDAVAHARGDRPSACPQRCAPSPESLITSTMCPDTRPTSCAAGCSRLRLWSGVRGGRSFMGASQARARARNCVHSASMPKTSRGRSARLRRSGRECRDRLSCCAQLCGPRPSLRSRLPRL